jgi:glycosyltransferase involved in cell wall biosynthesis
VRLIFINRYFHPDHSATSQMLSDLAFALAGRGHTVEVVTSRQIYDAPKKKLPAQESVGGLAIHRVWTSHFGRQNLIGRTADYLTFYASAASTLWRVARPGDILIAKTDPPMLSVIAAPIARLRGARLVTWLQDLFPEVAEAAGLGRGRLAGSFHGALRAIRNRSLHSAAANVTLGDRMAQRLEADGIKPQSISIIHNWADSALIRPIAHHNNALRSAWRLNDKFIIGYSGNLGRAHEYDTLLDAISQVETKQRAAQGPNGSEWTPARSLEIVWLILGGGALYNELAREVGRRGLTSVLFKPYQPRDRLAESLSAADVHLISLRRELEGLIVPSKFYGIAAAGRPAIFIGDGDGEIARLLAKHRCGRAIAQGDGVGLARNGLELAANPALCQKMGKRARQAFEAEFDKPLAVARWESLLLTVAGAAPRTTQADGLPDLDSGLSVRKAS